MNKKTYFLLICFLIIGWAHAQPMTENDLLASAKKLDVDYLGDFKEGIAVVAKGNSSTIINSKGELVIPFGVYNFYNVNSWDKKHVEGFVNGLCIVQDIESGKVGFVNTSGKIVIPCQYLWADPIDNEGYATVLDQKKQKYFITKDNKKIALSNVFVYIDYNVRVRSINPMSGNGGLENVFKARPAAPTYKPTIYVDFSDGLCPGFDELFGYYDRTGKKIIANQFEFARPFHEGLAAVSKKNSFGEVKWGFIDKTGKTIIDFKFSNQPGDFHNGLSVIIPAVQNEFQYAFMDKSGQIFYTVKEKVENELLDFQGNVAWVPNKGHLELFDKSGNFFDFNINSNKKDRKGRPIWIKNFSYSPTIVNETIRVNINTKFGIVDLKGNVLIPVVFDSVEYPDPVSGLSKAIYTNLDNQKIEGYINSQGRFVIVKGLSSNW